MKATGNNDIQLDKTGVAGLDEILYGGLTSGSVHLVEGPPGSGKTTLGLRFSLEGLKAGRKVLYLALSESRNDLEIIAGIHGWKIETLNIIELVSEQVPPSSMFHSMEEELARAIQRVREAVERIEPSRLVIDSLSEFRIMGQSGLRYRREMLGLRRFLTSRGCTALLLDLPACNESVRSIADGVILFETSVPAYGAVRRQLRVLKERGRPFMEGYHDYLIENGGLEVFPRISATGPRTRHYTGPLRSGLNELDVLVGNGLGEASSTLLVGPAGVGKSGIAMLYADSALNRSETVLYFTSDEHPECILARAKRMGMDLQKGIDEERLHLQQIEPARMPPGQFANIIRSMVQTRKVRLVILDSLNGYYHAIHDERCIARQLHELFSYLGQKGVCAIVLINQTQYDKGWKTPVDLSYLTDNILLFSFFESCGKLRRVFTVIKTQSEQHDRTIRELHIEKGVFKISGPLEEFDRVLFGQSFPCGVLQKKTDL